jgi:hypothetical protein
MNKRKKEMNNLYQRRAGIHVVGQIIVNLHDIKLFCVGDT